MDVHEYQAKNILKKYGIPITDFVVVKDVDEAIDALEKKKWDEAVVKVQVHAGGRGKAGGVKLCKTRDEIILAVKQLIGMKIVNNQTGKAGVTAHEVLISPLTKYLKEYYLGATIDRKNAQALLIASPEGGMDIEEVALKTPDKILKVPIDTRGAIKDEDLDNFNHMMGWTDHLADLGKKIASNLAKAFIETDASLLEINPLVVTVDRDIVALDAKLSVDDNALFRQEEIKGCYDKTQLLPAEVKAKEFDLSYIALDGEIGCMVNGAGLAMATMDIIKHYGGTPANFLDVGGGATKEKVSEGFKIILSDPQVKAILVNIFGGIMNCATLAEGIIYAAKDVQIKVPLVVRMEGTNVDEGKRLLKQSKLNIIIAKDLKEAALKVVSLAKGE